MSNSVKQLFSSSIKEIFSLNKECLELQKRFYSLVTKVSDDEVEFSSISNLSFEPISDLSDENFYLLKQEGERKKINLTTLNKPFDGFKNILKTTLPDKEYIDLEEEIRVYELLRAKKGVDLVVDFRDRLKEVKKIMEVRIEEVGGELGIAQRAWEGLETKGKKELYFKLNREPYISSFCFKLKISFTHEKALNHVEDLQRIVTNYFQKVEINQVTERYSEIGKEKINKEKSSSQKSRLEKLGLQRELKVQHFLTDSTLINRLEDKELLMKWLEEEYGDGRVSKTSVLWRGSRDGFASSSFHMNCDSKGPNLVLVRANNCTFGGFSHLSWTSNGGTTNDTDRKTFLFSIDRRQKMKQGGGSDSYGQKTICRDASSGPIFGGGRDLCISNNCNRNNESFTHLGYSFSLPSGLAYSETSSWKYLCGSERFQVDEIEVYKID